MSADCFVMLWTVRAGDREARAAVEGVQPDGLGAATILGTHAGAARKAGAPLKGSHPTVVAAAKTLEPPGGAPRFSSGAPPLRLRPGSHTAEDAADTPLAAFGDPYVYGAALDPPVVGIGGPLAP